MDLDTHTGKKPTRISVKKIFYLLLKLYLEKIKMFFSQETRKKNLRNYLITLNKNEKNNSSN